MTNIHFLKIWPTEFKKVRDGEKTLEVRRDDRNPRYQPGDMVVLEHYRPPTPTDGDETRWRYQGDHLVKRIGYIERGEHVPAGFCAFQLLPPNDGDEALIEEFHEPEGPNYGRRCRLRFAVSATSTPEHPTQWASRAEQRKDRP